jgi:hypothetical protein
LPPIGQHQTKLALEKHKIMTGIVIMQVMSKDPAKLEKALAKQARRDARKEKEQAKKDRIVGVVQSEQINVSGAGSWSLLGCWISEEWKNTMSLCQLVIARQNAAGIVGVGLFLIDLGCLGIKDAHSRGFTSEFEFKNELLDMIASTQPIQPCSLDFAAKIVQTAIAYAKGLGFEPHKDARKALRLLGEAHPENCSDDIPTGGEDGKPFFMSGPYDNVNKIMSTLNRSVGAGNYNIIIGGGMDLLDDLEYLDDNDEDEDEKIIDVQAHPKE